VRGTSRTYGEGCAAAHALDLVGERWALLVVRELLLGPKRFTDLRAGVMNASANLLSQRLRELEEAGVVRRRTLAPPAASHVYELTEWGRELEPVLLHLGHWGSRSPRLPLDAPMSLDSQLLAMKTLFDPVGAADLSARYQLALGLERFRIEVDAKRIKIARGPADRPDATVETDRDTLADLVFHGLTIEAAKASGRIRIDGNEQAVERLLGLFPLPDPAAACQD
jgi:DNA-binding HxlR family transcriptional regulator/putative sterol carrier protein